MAKTSLLATLARAVAYFVFWLLLVDGVDEPNLITGGVCALAAAGLVAAVQGRKGAHARLRPSMLRRAYRPFLLLISDSLRVSLALVTRLCRRRVIQGSFRAVRYQSTGDAEEDLARRLLTEWSVSLAANRYAIGIDREKGILLVHQLVPAPGPLDPLELG